MNPRHNAVLILLQVTQHHHSLTDSLANELPKLKDPRDRAFVQALCFGVCRAYFQLDAIAKKLLQKPMKVKDQDIYLLILLGLYQLIEMRLPEYAAISETVETATTFKKIWAKNLVNAVLRTYQRQPFTLPEPDNWINKKIKQDWPHDWETILKANLQHPPLSLRVNLQKISRDEYVKKVSLHLKETQVFIIPETQSGIYLEPAMNVEEIPGFKEGEVSVQDGAAQLAAELLQIQPHQYVLDACAAPGGKTAHILEIANKIELIALDHDPDRLASLKENFVRLQLSATCICADAGNPNTWWDKKLFDRILLDAPCSATGVIRRHPDIKLLRKPSDIPKLVAEQSRLLNILWPLLKPKGLLVYATCSIFSDESTQVIKNFLQTHPDAQEQKIEAHWGVPCEVGRQILPGMHGMDGFYYVCLSK